MGWMAVVAILATTAYSQTLPTAIDIPEGLQSRGELLRSHKAQVVARLNHWIRRLREAKTEEAIIQARKGLLGDYAKYDHPNYRNCFATLAIGQLTDLLDAKGIEPTDPHRKVKRINAAMAMSEMPHSPVQPAMEKMVADENEAIRYFGWKVYIQARNLLMVGGDRTFGKMVASLKRAAAEESNGRILALVYGSMDLSAPEFERFKDIKKSARAEFLKVLTETFPARRRQILDGNLETLNAMRYTASPLAFLAAGESKAQATQLIANLTDSAAKLMDQAREARKNLTGKEREKNNAQRIAGKKLLQAMEEALQSVTGQNKAFLHNALKGGSVESGWLKWAQILIDSHGASLPKDPPKPPAKS